MTRLRDLERRSLQRQGWFAKNNKEYGWRWHNVQLRIFNKNRHDAYVLSRRLSK